MHYGSNGARTANTRTFGFLIGAHKPGKQTPECQGILPVTVLPVEGLAGLAGRYDPPPGSRSEERRSSPLRPL